jgi:hypothetical protein
MFRLGRALRVAWRLPWWQRRLVAEAWLLMPLTTVGLRRFGFGRTRTALGLADGAWNGRIDLAAAQVVAGLVRWAALWSPAQPNCLVQSLVICRLLRQQRLAGVLRIGVDEPNANFSAHAWVEHASVVLSDAPDIARRFAAFGRAVLSAGIDAK